MTEQELFNEYRKSNCKSFSDFLINKISELEKEKDKAWWEGFDTCKTKAGEANVKLNDELEKLKKQLEELPDKWCRNKDDYCPHLAKLEKENAELKGIKDVATLIRANNDTVITLMQLNNKLVSKSQQLTKAKELLKQFLEHYKAKTIYVENISSLLEEAENFLSEVEK